MLRKLFDYFLFSSFYVACCAVVMVTQTNHLLHLRYDFSLFYVFVFFSTVCSYNFHWYLTPDRPSEQMRMRWKQQHKSLHLYLSITGLAGAAICALSFIQHWFWLGGAVLLTFLYSAPKIPLYPFTLLRKIAVGKTIFLAFVWMYVTTFLPVVFSDRQWQWQDTLFCISRFFLIYSICIIFDFRDRTADKQEGIRSLITYFSERGIDNIFRLSLILFTISTVALYPEGFHPLLILVLLVPGVITLFLYPYCKKHFSDYLYYFVLDGLMMFSALFTSLMSIR